MSDKILIEAVPNFSEGNNLKIIAEIENAIKTTAGVVFKGCDIGKSANRTVMTFYGSPDDVCNAAFNAVKKAAELINMNNHKGEHPRIGATDVLPLIPLKNISLAQTSEYARKLSQRIGDELEIPVYCYEESAFCPERKNLEFCRKGEYEGLSQKLTQDNWKPDFGPSQLKNNAGLTVCGARNFLIAYNINLSTKLVKTAKMIAGEIRESGFIDKNHKGETVKRKGLLKNVKAIGWYMEEFKTMQVSMNLTNYLETPLWQVFETAKLLARKYSVQITGSELVGLIPEDCILDAGRYYLSNYKFEKFDVQNKEAIIDAAIEYLGLNSVKDFDKEKNILRID